MFYVINPDGRSIDFQGHTVGESHESLHSAIAACKAIIDDCVLLRLAPMFPRIAESRETFCDAVDVRTVNVLRLFNHEGTPLPIVSGQ